MNDQVFHFDDREIPYVEGMTIGAALLAAGYRSWRTTRVGGRPRGIFCGIGVCYDCLITVDGQPNQRACVTPAAPGLEVRTQEGAGHADHAC